MDVTFIDAFEDLDTLKELFSEYASLLVSVNSDFGKYLTLQHWDDELSHPERKYAEGGRMFIFKVDGITAGCCGFKRLRGNDAELKRMFLRPAFRGHHYSQIMLDKCLSSARELGYEAIYLDTLPELKSAIGLYKKNGFTEIPRYNDNPIEDQVIYLKKEL